jgi:hypothetical protein
MSLNPRLDPDFVGFCGFMALWLCGFIASWLHSFVTLWLGGFVRFFVQASLPLKAPSIIRGEFTSLSMKHGQNYSVKIVNFFWMNAGSYSTSL